jgi:hypothetical protein
MLSSGAPQRDLSAEPEISTDPDGVFVQDRSLTHGSGRDRHPTSHQANQSPALAPAQHRTTMQLIEPSRVAAFNSRNRRMALGTTT